MSESIEKSPNVPPFVTFVTSAVPMVFDNSLSYYEALCALWKWLQDDVVNVINNNATVTEDYIQLTKDMKEYMDNYFDNLDVQEEINNKLDAMAESGQLTDIIAQYLTLAGILVFPTVDDLADAENLAIGSKVMTYGYKRMGDGVYDRYNIRAILNTDTIDGYNLVSLTHDNTLVAERLQYGKELNIQLNATDDIQEYLDLVGKKTISLPANTTVTVDDALMVNSDTSINLNGSTIVFDYARPTSFPAVDWDETLGFVSFKANDTFTDYNGNKNIYIYNGAIQGGCSCFLHSVNVKFECVSFSDLASRHALQFAGCSNVTITKCEFNGTLHQAGEEEAAECINIDPCTYGGQPWLDDQSVMYDDTPNKFFTIDANKFNTASSVGQLYACGAGAHGGAETSPLICDNITFTNNDFGAPYKDAVTLRDFNNAVVAHNTVEFSNTHDTYTALVHIRGGVTNVIINDNMATNVGQLVYTDSNQRARKNILIEGNTVDATDVAGYAVIQLFHFENVNIQNNTIKAKYRAVHTDGIYSSGTLVSGTESKTVSVKNNDFYSTDGGDVYLRFKHTQGCVITKNNIDYVGVNNMAWEWTIALQEGVTNPIIMHNTTSDPKHFLNVTSMSDKVMYNGAQYRLANTSSASQTGTLASALTNFTKLVLPIGSTDNTQFVEILPWTPHNRNRFFWGDDTTRIYRFALVNADGTYGKGVLTLNSDNTYSYTGDLSLRGIYAYD